MTSATFARDSVIESDLIPIFENCQRMINGASYICVSRELDASDTEIIIEVVLDILKMRDKEKFAVPKNKRAIINRIRGLYKKFLSKKEIQ